MRKSAPLPPGSRIRAEGRPAEQSKSWRTCWLPGGAFSTSDCQAPTWSLQTAAVALLPRQGYGGGPFR
ncbi:hypothetical protein SSP531S_59040 [Streptomyces spongiicola]|uniref:Uncharacterized protein n=1 Tax=Streptomyces spongiicola TaxID=1690221 RepID=A0A388T626_9ACTN|nr:hypothetical protein SSP531S_59040 [Streptomyces spongiicola]